MPAVSSGQLHLEGEEPYGFPSTDRLSLIPNVSSLLCTLLYLATQGNFS